MSKVTPQRIEIQQPEVKNRASLTESLFARVGASINWIIENATEQVGDIKESLLTEAQFQEQRNDKWVLIDGRDISGSDLAALTGLSTLPDFRGLFLRGKNNGRDDAFADVEGERSLGSIKMDKARGRVKDYIMTTSNQSFGSKTISFPDEGNTAYSTAGGNAAPGNPARRLRFRTEGLETAPKNGAVNFFIKINA